MKSVFRSLALTAGLIAGATITTGLTSLRAQSALGFDDLGPSTIGVHMLDGYGGFNWTTSDWHFMSQATAPVTYKVNIKTNGKGSVAVSRTGTSFLPGTILTLTATPAVGSPWVGWSGDVSGVARTITVTVDRPLTIQANFR